MKLLWCGDFITIIDRDIDIDPFLTPLKEEEIYHKCNLYLGEYLD